MPRVARYTSPAHSLARVAAQRLLLKPVSRAFVDVTVSGQANVRGFRGAAVVMSNHSSHLDAPLILTSLPRRLGVSVATGAASDYFFQVSWRRPLTSLFFNAFPIDRSGQRGRNKWPSMLLDAGVPILMFAEGTRSRTGVMAAFKTGTAALCVSRGVPALPLALVGAYEAWPPGSRWIRPGRPPVHVAIGAPVDPEPGETPRNFADRLAERVRSMYDEHAAVMGLPSQAERAKQLGRAGPDPHDDPAASQRNGHQPDPAHRPEQSKPEHKPEQNKPEQNKPEQNKKA